MPWGALSGLSADRNTRNILYAVHDHNLHPPEILVMDLSPSQATIRKSIHIRKELQPPPYDLEGISHRSAGGFWLASEGKPGRHLPNLIILTDAQGRVLKEIPLPPEVARYRIKAGLEGIASSGEDNREQVVVVFQRRWKDDPRGQVKIGQYWPATGQWYFYRYPLDAPRGTGLSAVTALGNGDFAVLERDNRPFFKAQTKVIYKVHLPAPTGQSSRHGYPLLKKQLLRDILPLYPISCGTNGKLEGMALDSGRDFLMIADDDGKSDALLLRLH
ncbi:esterase-like activity of phytase family protein, partial [Thiolapillus brandeum]|uniref:esterase-like activity of phytase family protein n=1 Tax=Thiolapillus brandeum TaxID=1076588 RepID=UPI000597C645